MKRREGIVAIVTVVVVCCFAISAYAAPAPKLPTDVNAVVLEPIQAHGQNRVNGGLATVYTVPEGKRLIIEFVSATVVVGNYSDKATMILRTWLSGTWYVHYIVLTPQDDWTGGSRLGASQPTRLYAAPGTDVQVQFNCGTDLCGEEALSEVTITGFLMDVP